PCDVPQGWVAGLVEQDPVHVEALDDPGQAFREVLRVDGADRVEAGRAGESGGDVGEQRLIELDGDLRVEAAGQGGGVGVDSLHECLREVAGGTGVGDDAVA